MAFVGQTINPWDVPVKQSIMVMQRIWDVTNSYDYKITAEAPVYQKVRDILGCEMILIHTSDCPTARRLMAQCHGIYRYCRSSSIYGLPG